MTMKHLFEQKLEGQIQMLRLKMISSGCTRGLTDPYTVKISQMLDAELNKYQKLVLQRRKRK